MTAVLAFALFELVALQSNWPASHEKEPLDITNSVEPDKPTYNVEISIRDQNVYTARKKLCF